MVVIACIILQHADIFVDHMCKCMLSISASRPTNGNLTLNFINAQIPVRCTEHVFCLSRPQIMTSTKEEDFKVLRQYILEFSSKRKYELNSS